MSLDSFSRQQEQLRTQFTRAFASTPGGSFMEEAVRQNLAMFERAMQMWPGMPGYVRAADPAAEPRPEPRPETRHEPEVASAAGPSLEEMRRQMDEMRAQIDRLAKADPDK